MLLSIVAKITVTTGLALCFTSLARRSRASLRHAVLVVSFTVLLAVPIASVIPPPVRIPWLASVQTWPLAFPGPLNTAQTQPRTAQAPHPVVGTAPLGAGEPSLYSWLMAAWVTGAAVCLFPMIGGLFQLRSMRRTAVPWQAGEAAVIPPRTALMLHDSLPGPITFGILRPVIMLPEHARRWNPEDLNRALLYEREHVRRGDWALQCTARFLCAAYWFHPLVWIARRQLSVESERCCDDAVLEHSDGATYAEQLVAFARRMSSASRASQLAMASQSHLATRITALLDPRQAHGRTRPVFVAAACSLVCLAAVLASPQQAVPTSAAGIPKFEVASVKRCNGGAGARSPGRMKTPCTFLSVLINHAYVDFAGGRLNPRGYPVAIEGLPAWAVSELYQIEAKAEGSPGMGSTDGPMLQALLEDRFALRLRKESRQGPVYLLTVAKGGLKAPSFQGGCIPVDPTLPPEPIRDTKTCRPVVKQEGPNVTIDQPAWDLDTFASYLANFSGIGAPVLNRTGITGLFHFHLEYALASAEDPVFPSVFKAVDQQLGLKLTEGRGPRQFLVVEDIERPAAN